MPTDQRAMEPPEKSSAGRWDDLALWATILVPLHAAGINTIVGFSVAHHACNVDKKGALLTVPIIDLILTLASAALAGMLRARFHGADDVQPVDGRRLFMANMGLLMAALCTLLILGGLFAAVILSPCD